MNNVDNLRSRIKSYNLRRRSGDLNLRFTPTKISIRLFGMLGHGKSTLINNFFCVLNNTEYRNIADETSPEESDGGGKTMALRLYPLDNTCLEIVDNRGCNEFKYSEQTEFRNQMEGKRRVNSSVNFQGDFTASFQWAESYVSPWSWSEWCSQWYFNESPSDDTIIVPVLVIRAGWTPNKKMLSNLHKFCTTVVYPHTGVYPLIVLTCGQERPEWEGRHILPQLPCSTYLLNNYHERSSERNPNTDQIILEILIACINCADNVLKRCIGLANKPVFFQ